MKAIGSSYNQFLLVNEKHPFISRGCFLNRLRAKDSNLHRQIQSLQSYHWTSPHCYDWDFTTLPSPCPESRVALEKQGLHPGYLAAKRVIATINVIQPVSSTNPFKPHQVIADTIEGSW